MTEQLSFTLEPPRARRADPETSHAAARRADQFQQSHAGRILNALRLHGPQTAHQIAERTGLTVVQVDRRLPECKAAQLARVVQEGGRDMTLGGFRVWEAA